MARTEVGFGEGWWRDATLEIGVDEMGGELWRVEPKGVPPKNGATIHRNGKWYTVARGTVRTMIEHGGLVVYLLAREVPAPPAPDDEIHQRMAAAMYACRRRFAAKAGLALPEYAALGVADRAAIVAEAAAARSIFEAAVLDNPHSQERPDP